MTTSTRKPVLVAIAGGSGSGKSWLATRLAERLPGRVEVVCMDAFYRDRAHLTPAQMARVNFDTPRAIDGNALRLAAETASRGEVFRVPVYDYVTHMRTGTRDCRPGRIVIFEGLWILRSNKLRSLFDHRIFVDAPTKWRLEKRLARDVGERARSRASIIRQFRDQVEPMHQRYVEPQKRRADDVLLSPVSEEAVESLLEKIGKQRR